MRSADGPTLPDPTITAFEDHGTVARTIDIGVNAAVDFMHRLAAVGVDMDDVGRTLEDAGGQLSRVVRAGTRRTRGEGTPSGVDLSHTR